MNQKSLIETGEELGVAILVHEVPTIFLVNLESTKRGIRSHTTHHGFIRNSEFSFLVLGHYIEGSGFFINTDTVGRLLTHNRL